DRVAQGGGHRLARTQAGLPQGPCQAHCSPGHRGETDPLGPVVHGNGRPVLPRHSREVRRPGYRVDHAASWPIGLRSVPMPVISTSIVSPGFIHSGGFWYAPTPPVVPVTITSPASSRMKVEQYSINVGISKHRSSRVACCCSLPFRRVMRCARVMSPVSSGVTIHGPKAPDLCKFLPGM